MAGKKRKIAVIYRALTVFQVSLRILIICLVVLMLAYLGKTAYTIGCGVFHEEAVEMEPGKDRTVMIPEGTSVYSIGRTLKEAGLIESEFTFFLQELLSGYHGQLEAGTFTLNTSMLPSEMLEILSGRTPEET